MEEEVKTDRNKEALKAGVTLGLISVFLILVYYIFGIRYMVTWQGLLFSFLFSFGSIIFFGIRYRNQYCDGFINFKNSYLFSFVVFFISGVITNAFLILMYELIDPSVSKHLTEQFVENYEGIFRWLGMQEVQIEKALDEGDVYEKTKLQFSTIGILKSSYGLILSPAFISLFTSLIIRKSKPDFQ